MLNQFTKKFLLGFLLLAIAQVGCQKQAETLTEQEKTGYRQKGKAIAQKSFEALSGELMAAMKRGGVSEALQYCNLEAMPLVDSLSQVHRAAISRTTLKTRNPKNAPTQVEKKMLEAYRKEKALGKPLNPQVQRLENGEVLFSAPILLANPCLKCHGQPNSDIAPEDGQLIQELYPKDEATGYSLGDLRGMWSIRFAN